MKYAELGKACKNVCKHAFKSFEDIIEKFVSGTVSKAYLAYYNICT
jgi:hypothetical protein